MKEIFGYVLTLLVAPLAGWLADHYGARDLAPILVGGFAGLGGRLLHTSEPPAGKGALPTGLMPLLLLLPLVHGCAWLQKPATQNVVRCTGSIVNGCGEGALGTIAACLAAPANPTPCLLALLSTGSCVSKQAIACRVRDAAQPPVIMGFTSIYGGEAQAHKEAQAEVFFHDVGVEPVAP